jgi:predicted enzyme related to lactoylglutathione lyase
MTISHVQLFSVPVRDLDRAKQFYLDALGFDLVADMPLGADGRWVQVRPRSGDTSITLVTWFDTMAAGSMKGVVLETDDLEADIESLASRGVEFSGPIAEMPWGRYVTFDDLDGNGFVLQTTTPADA